MSAYGRTRLQTCSSADVQFRILVMHGLRSYQAADPAIVVTFHVVEVDRLLTDKEIEELRLHDLSERSSIGPGGTRDTCTCS